jgi:hypothetical protein
MRGNAQPTVVHERLPGARLWVATCCLAVNLKAESELQWSFTAPKRESSAPQAATFTLQSRRELMWGSLQQGDSHARS